MTTTQPETHAFQAETQQLLDLMIHSLYSHKEVFLRELISNASDALDKLRFAALTDPSLREGGDELTIRLERDPVARTLVVEDNGIGMSREEVIENIGTIARSGTRRFLDELRQAQAGGKVKGVGGSKRAKGAKGGAQAESDADQPGDGEGPELIGQFGVGFYASFMVADKVVLETLKAGSDQAVCWSSAGDGQYTIEDGERTASGTRITLHLRERDADTEESEFQDFCDEWTLRSTVKRYSDFVTYPIQMEVEREQERDGKKEKVTSLEVLNSQKPLWTRPRSEVSEEEHRDFYQHLTHDWTEPLATVHFRAEGTHEYTALLYIPKQRAQDILDPTRNKSRISLYVKRVFVMQECEELLPPWLRFVRGLVDSSDLPLNVSRETLQHNRQIRQIRKRLVRKVLEVLEQLRDTRRSEFEAFWASLGPVVKEGLYLDDEHREELAKLCLWQSSATGPTGTAAKDKDEDKEDADAEGGASAAASQEEADKAGGDGESTGDGPPASPADSVWTTLEAYVERTPMAQKALYYALGPDRAAVENSPHLEAMRARGFEVLFLTDPIDEWVVQRLERFGGLPFKAVDRGEDDLDDDDTKAEREAKQEQMSPVLQAVRESLDDYVKEVRLSTRLKDSPAVLVSDEGALSPAMEAAMRAAGHPVPASKRILELNPDHPVLARLQQLHGDAGQGGEGEVRFHGFVEVLHGQALLAEGAALPDPARFARLVAELMVPE